jgi:CRP-like cAMP-binding protein
MLSVLAQSKLFKGLDPSILQAVQQHAHRHQVESGHQFVQQGKPALAVYVLIHGYAKIVQVTPDGHQVLMRYIGPGQEFGLVSVLEGFEYPASVQAVEECEALFWQGELLAQFIERYSRIAFNTLRIMAHQNQETQRRYQELLTEHVEQRLAQAILRLAQQVGHSIANGTLIDLPLSREDLAEIIGTDLYSISRLMSHWERDGLIQTDRKSIVLLRKEALERLAAQS